MYDKESKQVINTRDMVFEEETAEYLQPNYQNTRVQEIGTVARQDGQASAQLAEVSGTRATRTTPQSEVEPNTGDPLPPINTEEDTSKKNTNDKETIVVRAPATSSYPGIEEEYSPVRTSPNRKSQRVHQRRQMFKLPA